MHSVRFVLLSISAACLAVAQETSPLPPDTMGDLLMARKQFREAVDAYRKGPQDSPVTWNKIGIAYHQLGDLGAAKRNYEKAIRLDKTYADAVNNDGTVYYAQKRYGTAISRYRLAIKLRPDAASFWSNLGTAYYSRHRINDMIAAYQKALELDPTVFEHKGLVGTELQDRSVTDRARYHYEMARLYAKSGNADLALQYLRRSLEEGLKDKPKMIQAPEFAKLRDTDAFKQIVALEPRVL
jgi:tetratricopeptide (TPR) repeat protein